MPLHENCDIMGMDECREYSAVSLMKGNTETLEASVSVNTHVYLCRA